VANFASACKYIC